MTVLDELPAQSTAHDPALVKNKLQHKHKLQHKPKHKLQLQHKHKHKQKTDYRYIEPNESLM